MISQGSNSKFNFELVSGDVIIVPAINNTVVISGEVQQEGIINIDRPISAKAAIDYVGGFTNKSVKKEVYVEYQNGLRKVTKTFLFFKFYPRVYPGSIVVVPEKAENEQKTSVGEIVGYTTSLVSIIALIKSLLVMNEIQNQHTSEDEIDLIELFKKVYNEKKLIFKATLFAVVLGIVYALFQPNEFTSSTTFIPQLSSGVKTGGSSLGGLASLAGINLGGMESSSEFPPTLYPQVVESVGFKLDLLASTINLNDEEILVKDYFSNQGSSFNVLGTIKKYTIGLPSLVLGSFNSQDVALSKSEIYSVSQEDKELFNTISDALSLSINDKEGFITISFTDSDKNIAAQITQITQNLLQEKIIEFKNQSSNEMLDFAIKQYDENKNSYEKLQDERAIFVDKNINISSSLFQNKLDRIESEVNISESIVQQLASQVEQAKLQVNKDTPVFTTIQPVTIPFERSAPKRSLIVIVFGFLGIVVSVGYVLVKEPLNEIIKSIKS